MIWNRKQAATKPKPKAKAKAKTAKRVTAKASRAKKAKTTQSKRVVKKKANTKPVVATKKKAVKKPCKKIATKTKLSTSTNILNKATALATIKKNPIIRLSRNQDAVNVEGRLAVAFNQLHTEFNKREKQLEARMHEIKVHHDLVLEHKKNRRKWLIPLAFAAAIAGGYMLYVLTSMQNSMSHMTSSIDNMDSSMTTMSANTYSMAQNVQMMNHSMYNMNGNVKEMSQAMEPMGDVASAASPFTQMFRFLPF